VTDYFSVEQLREFEELFASPECSRTVALVGRALLREYQLVLVRTKKLEELLEEGRIYVQHLLDTSTDVEIAEYVAALEERNDSLEKALENLCGDVYLYGLREITEQQLRESSGKAQDVLRVAREGLL